jgi:hypothetical protein
MDTSVLGYPPVVSERRAHDRHLVDENALLIIPSVHVARPCRVVNISPAGASIECDIVPRANTEIRLVMKGGRVFAAVTAWFQDGRLGLRFVTVAHGQWSSLSGFELWACARP